MTDFEPTLRAYAELVARWSPRLDLVAPGDLPRFRERHIDDCLRLLPVIARCGPGPGADVGSGAGLPGIVLAIADPGREWRLLEPRSKRASFLEEVARELQLGNVDIRHLTAQRAAKDRGLAHSHAVAVARAVAPPAESLKLLRPLLRRRGKAVVFVGKHDRIPVGTQEWGRGIAVLEVGG